MANGLCRVCEARTPRHFVEVTVWRGLNYTEHELDVCEHCLKVYEALLDPAVTRRNKGKAAPHVKLLTLR